MYSNGSLMEPLALEQEVIVAGSLAFLVPDGLLWIVVKMHPQSILRKRPVLSQFNT